MNVRCLLDKSALARRGKPGVRSFLDPLVQRGLLAVTGVVEVEMLYSARNAREADLIRELLRGFDYLPCPDEAWDRALDVQVQAIRKGDHRALSLADLLIAATAEHHGVSILHYDEDCEQIATLTGQPHQWVAEPGTAD